MSLEEILFTVERIRNSEVRIEAINQAFAIEHSGILLYYTFWLTTLGAAFVTSLGSFLTLIFQAADYGRAFSAVAFVLATFFMLIMILLGYRTAEKNLKSSYDHGISMLIVQQQEVI